MQVLIPISSRSKFFPEKDYFFPIPLIDVDGVAMIERVVNSIKDYVTNPKFIFIVDQADCLRFSLDKLLKILGGTDSIVVQKNTETAGALCSALLAIDHLNLEEPLLISNCDTVLSGDVRNDFAKLKDTECDAGIFTFKSIHPRWSYVRSSSGYNVNQVYEKDVVSDNAITGIYYYKRTNDFITSAQEVILNGVSIDDKYFISSTLNQILLRDKKVYFIPLQGEQIDTFYSPETIEKFTNKNHYRSKTANTKKLNIIIPAAGMGSRFAKQGWKKPKPFIDVLGSPMVARVMSSLDANDCTFRILMRNEHIKEYPDDIKLLQGMGAEISSVPNITEGTACTVLSAEQYINNEEMLLIANSDQIVDFDVNAYVQDCLDRNLDGSILVFKDLARDPKWSFAKVSESGFVTEVAEKQPISDMATVGIYLFRRGRSFVKGAIEMIVANERVNNEFYTCPVYNYLIGSGLKIGVYEVPRTSMHGIGTPEDLKQYLSQIHNTVSVDEP